MSLFSGQNETKAMRDDKVRKNVTFDPVYI